MNRTQSANVNKKLYIELVKKHGLNPNKAINILNQLELKNNSSYEINDLRSSEKGGLEISVFDSMIVKDQLKPYNKEVRKLITYSKGSLKRIEYYDKTPGLPDRSKYNNTLPAVIEWWPNGKKRRETYLQHNKKHRTDGPAEINYDQNGNITEEKYYTLGITQDKIEAGKEQEKDFNKKKEEKNQKYIEDYKAKKAAKEAAKVAEMGKIYDQDTAGAIPSAVSNKDSAATAKPSDSLEPAKKSEFEDMLGTFSKVSNEPKPTDNKVDDWKNKSPDEKIEIDDMSDDFNFRSGSSDMDLMNKKSDKKAPLEIPDEKKSEPVKSPEVKDSGTSKKDDQKNIHKKIIDYISKFLTKKHKEKLTPETLKKIQDYYTSKYRSDKEAPGVLDKYRKEKTGRGREKFDISIRENLEFEDSVILEVYSLVEEYLEKYNEI